MAKALAFARSFLLLRLSYIEGYLGVSLFENINFIPGLIVVGAF